MKKPLDHYTPLWSLFYNRDGKQFLRTFENRDDAEAAGKRIADRYGITVFINQPCLAYVPDPKGAWRYVVGAMAPYRVNPHLLGPGDEYCAPDGCQDYPEG